MRPLSSARTAATLVLAVVLTTAACDDGAVDPEPTLTIQELTTEFASALGEEPPDPAAEKSIKDLARATCKVMAQDGGCAAGLQSPGSSVVAAGSAGDVLSLLPARDPWQDALRGDGPPLLPAVGSPEAIPPLGATCIWNVENDGWAGSPPIFGEVPDDRTRFEDYETEAGGPMIPLQKTGNFFDVAPITQNTVATARSEVNVEVGVREQGGNTILSLLMAGSIDPSDGDVVDLLMSGRSGSSGDPTALDYVFAVDPDRVVNTMALENLLVLSELDASGNGSFLIRKRNDPRQAVEFVFRLSGTNSISTGDVYVGTDRVASMSGNRGGPTFELTDPDTFDEDENLTFVYEHVLTMDVRVIDLFFFGYCIGANTPEVCNQMRTRFGVG